MLKLNESSRSNPSVLTCECGEANPMTYIHKDGLEIQCFGCDKRYFIGKANITNCCMPLEKDK